MIRVIQAKKHLGQHFLIDDSIAKKIVSSLSLNTYKRIVEVGPGMGALTKHLIKRKEKLFLIELDKDAIAYLTNAFDHLEENQILHKDFLRWDPTLSGLDHFALIGNFPYNISSQIIFHLLTFKDAVPEVIGMFQKEVAQRLASKEGNKVYGKLSVLLQAFYKVEYLFELNPDCFSPAPKVHSAVLRLERKKGVINCDENLFFRLVKNAFSQRRKMLKNTLKSMNLKDEFYELPLLKKRPEALSVEEFIELTKKASSFIS